MFEGTVFVTIVLITLLEVGDKDFDFEDPGNKMLFILTT